MPHRDTICALSSGQGKSGVAVVRVSGPGALDAVARLAGRLPPARKAELRTIRTPDTGEEIDRAIVLVFAAPSSFTGEDVCEVHAHGGRAVVARVLSALTIAGCRMAEPGEFARRAFDHGKIDLTQAEGLADLIDAETEAQRVQAIRQAGGGLARLYDGWRTELITALALLEASIDFSDEADVANDAVAQSLGIVDGLVRRIRLHLADGRRGEILRDGFRVVLAGPPNAGKSSLLNALAQREAAIVSAEPGTTRDVIEVRLDLAGLPVIVSDTAGIREPLGAIEREGIRRSIARGHEADLVLWLDAAVASGRDVGDDDGGDIPEALLSQADRLVRVRSKADLVALPERREGGRRAQTGNDDGRTRHRFAVSATTGEGIADLIAGIAAVARTRIGGGEDAVITQARHRAAVEACLAGLGRCPSAGVAARRTRGGGRAASLAGIGPDHRKGRCRAGAGSGVRAVLHRQMNE